MKTAHSGFIILLGFLVTLSSSTALADGKGKGKHEKEDHEKDNNGIPGKVEALSQQVAALQDTVDAQAIQITELIALVDELSSGGGGVDLSVINGRLDDLESGQTVQDGRLDALEAAVDGLDLSGINDILSVFTRIGPDLYIDSNVLINGNLDVDSQSVSITTDSFILNSAITTQLISGGDTNINSFAATTLDGPLLNIGENSFLIFIGGLPY